MFEVDGATGGDHRWNSPPGFGATLPLAVPASAPSLQCGGGCSRSLCSRAVERLEPSADGGECAAKFPLLGDRIDCCVGHRKAPRCAMPGSPARKPQDLTGSDIAPS